MLNNKINHKTGILQDLVNQLKSDESDSAENINELNEDLSEFSGNKQ